MEQLSIKSGYDENDVQGFMSALRDLSKGGEVTPFDFTLTTFWGEAAVKADFASVSRYTLLREGRPVGLFQGLVHRKLFYKGIRAGSTSGNGVVVLPDSPVDAMRFFLRGILRLERFSDFAVFTSSSVRMLGFVEKLNYTFYIKLTHEIDALFRNMDKKTRNRVHKAEKDGVVVDFADSNEALKKAYHVINQTATEGTHSVPLWSYTARLHECFRHHGCCSIVALSYRKDSDNVVSAAHLIGFDGKLILWQAGSTDEGYNLNAGSLVQADIIKWGKDHGYVIYDMGGTHPTESAYAGIHKFKSGFGGDLVVNKLLQRRAFYVPLAARIRRAFLGFGLT